MLFVSPTTHDCSLSAKQLSILFLATLRKPVERPTCCGLRCYLILLRSVFPFHYGFQGRGDIWTIVTEDNLIRTNAAQLREI